MTAGSAVIGPASGIAQPQPHEQALALGFGPVAERRALVAERAVIDDLHLARLELEAGRHAGLVEDGLEGLQCRRSLSVERLAGELLAVLHLEMRQAGDQPAVLVLEHRMMGRHDVIWRMLALAVEVERLVEPR